MRRAAIRSGKLRRDKRRREQGRFRQPLKGDKADLENELANKRYDDQDREEREQPIGVITLRRKPGEKGSVGEGTSLGEGCRKREKKSFQAQL